MAIIKFGVTVVGARGTIGGVLFSANQAGPFARLWSKGANPRSPAQSEQRQRLSTRASAWRNLTQAERDDWIDYADDPPQELTNSLGETYFVSGFNWYITINDALQAAGEAVRVDAPTLTRPLAPVINFVALFVTGSASDTRINYTGAHPGLADNNVIFARIVSSQGSNFIPSAMPFMIIAVPTPGRSIVFQNELEAAFGNISINQRILLSTAVQDAHGQRGPIGTALDDAAA